MLTETDLIRAHQLQFKDEFLSHVSHELRSPLTAVYQFVSILLDGLAGELNPEQREYLEIVLRNAKQLHSMINDLFEVSCVQAGKLKIELQCTSVPDAIVYTVNTLQGAAAAKGITLSSDVHGKLPSVCADPTRVRQILIILVDNAIKFTPQSGAVKVRARMFEEDPVFLLVEVSDSGCGIAPEMTERIFERLFQAADPLTGTQRPWAWACTSAKNWLRGRAGKSGPRAARARCGLFGYIARLFSTQADRAGLQRRWTNKLSHNSSW